MVCSDCKQDRECRVDMQDTAYGPRMAPVCEACYRKDVADRKAEGKRFGYRPKVVAWEKLELASGR